jgi:hypothetical protein
MKATARAHQTNLYLSQAVPPEIEAGTFISIKVKASCPRGCDLRGTHVDVVTADEVVATGELVHHDGGRNETGTIELPVPSHVGEHAWSVRLARHESVGVLHEESSIPLSFKTIPHTFSVAVWDVPSAVPMGRAFHVKVGVHCSSACRLAGRLVGILDEEGRRVGEARLGDTPWPGSTSLYWAAIELTAPETEGVSMRSVAFADNETEPPHEAVPAGFTFRVDKAPEHSVTARVVEQQTGAGVPDVEVRLGRYATMTDEHGVASIALPTGTFEVTIRKDGLQAQPLTVAVNGDVALDIEAVTVPTRAELDARIFDDYPWG